MNDDKQDLQPMDEAAAAEATPPPADLDAEAELARVQADAERYLANWQRAQADLINYRRRAEQEREDAIKFGNVGLLKTLLPVFDDLERALATAPDDIRATPWFEGLQLLERKIATTLQAVGVEEIAAEGETFDPNVHEAVLYEAGEEGQVTAAFQKGYLLHGRVIRPSLVRVGSGGGSRSESAGTVNGQPA